MSQTEVIDTKQELIIKAQGYEVGEETQLSLAEAYKPFLEQAQAWSEQAREIVVSDVNDKEAMKQARLMRLQVKDLRVNLDKKRKELKADALQKGKAVDGIAKTIREMFEPTEQHLQEQEDFAKLLREKEVARLLTERKAQLDEYGFDSTFVQIGEMAEDDFQTLLSTAKASHDAKIKAEQDAAEAERKRLEEEKADQARIKEENERLKKEREQRDAEIEAERKKQQAELKAEQARREKELAAERAKADQERKEREQREAAERAEREAEEKKRQEAEAARLEVARKEREKAEAEAKELREAEERRQRVETERKRQEEEARQKALQASDREKLEKLLIDIAAIDLPDLESVEARRIKAAAVDFLDKAKDQIVTGLPTLQSKSIQKRIASQKGETVKSK